MFSHLFFTQYSDHKPLNLGTLWETLLFWDAGTLPYVECTPVKTLLFGAVWKDLETLGSARNHLERLAIQSWLKRYGHYYHQIQRQRLGALRWEGVRRKSLQGTQRKERDWSATDRWECHGEDEVTRIVARSAACNTLIRPFSFANTENYSYATHY